MRLRHLRWWIAGVLMCASVLNYLDRAALGVASAAIKDELHLSASAYAAVINAFLAAYTLSYAGGGWLVDRIGTRRSVILTLCWWSLANMAHAFAGGLRSLMACRFLLGLGEASFYPAALRGIAEWFRPQDRSKPVGMILAGASLGAVLAPLVVAPLLTIPGIGWRGAFAITGAAGFLVLPLWLLLYRPPASHPLLTDEERALLPQREGGDQAAEERPWSVRRLLALPQARLLIAIRALTDAGWYLLLFWLMLYFQKARGFTPADVARYGWIPYATADLGALFGGWLSSLLILRGVTIIRARQRVMWSAALCLPLTLAAFFFPREAVLPALALFSVATFAHMTWGTNLLTLHSDLFPTGSIATMMGITGAAGSLGGILAQQGVGYLVDVTGSYLPVFVATSIGHPVAALVLWLALRGKTKPTAASAYPL